MAAAQHKHKLSRRQVLAGACTAAALPLPRHSGVSGQSLGTVTSDCPRTERWRKALTRFRRAEAGLEAVAHSEDDALYDRALGRHNRALARLLRAPAPDLAAAADKLDLILRHSVFELNFGEASLEALRRDLRGFAGIRGDSHS